MSRREPVERIVGGCPCGFWSARNCRHVQARRVCRAPLAERPALHPHSGPAAPDEGAATPHDPP